MNVTTTELSALVPDPENARTHSARNLAAVRASLERYGQVEPLVVQAGTNRVIGGNGRLEVMLELGWTEAKVVEVEVNDDDARALGVTLNRTAELADWDLEQLAGILEGLSTSEVPVEVTGWNEAEMHNLVNADWTPPAADDGEELEGFAGSSGTADVERVTLVLEGELLQDIKQRALDDNREAPMSPEDYALELLRVGLLEGQ